MNKKVRYEWFLDVAAYLRIGHRVDAIKRWITEQIAQGPVTDLVLTGGVGDVISFRSLRGFSFDVYPREGRPSVILLLSPSTEVISIVDGSIGDWLVEEVEGPF